MNKLYRKPSCPFGAKAVNLLKSKSIPYEDHVFADDTEVEQFKTEHGVKSTPQIFFGAERVGGYSDLAQRLGEEVEVKEERSYKPVIAVFSVAALLAVATSAGIMGFMGFALAVLACLKLMDPKAFEVGFKKYDLMARTFPVYATVYPFAELAVGLGVLSGALPTLTGLAALLIGGLGGYSIYKAVYIDELDLDCACVGGNTKVPLGAISFSENAIMALMGLWLLI